ncbi:MAG: helix-turn-helix transcriptional regulator [Pseudomonadota bacterium]
MQDAETTADDFDWGDSASTFGDRLARAREYTGMDQSQLARRLGVKLATIRNWEADRSEPRSNRMQMLSGLLNVSIIWLINGEGAGAPEETEGDDETALTALLEDLHQVRMAQADLSKRTAGIEKQLRKFLSNR